MKIKFILFIFYFLIYQKMFIQILMIKLLLKLETEIITNYDIINEVNTILALSNRTADKNDFKDLQKLPFE